MFNFEFYNPTRIVFGKDRIKACTDYKELIVALSKVVGYNKRIEWLVPLKYDIEVDFR